MKNRSLCEIKAKNLSQVTIFFDDIYIYIYIYTDTNPITLPCSLVRACKNEKKK